jgi:hypothetical protein
MFPFHCGAFLPENKLFVSIIQQVGLGQIKGLCRGNDNKRKSQAEIFKINKYN